MSAPGGAVVQLGRLLSLIPWLLARPGVSVQAAAEEFGVSEGQLRKDLELAFVCGLPGHLPDDLIDVSLEGDSITVSNADAIARPLKLAPDEAAALLVGLRALSNVPGPQEHDALDRAVAKLERAAGDAADAGRRVVVDIEGEPQLTASLRQALADGRQVHLRYYVPARDSVTERDVDPLRIIVVEGRTYLEAWCHLAEDVRLFRLDRVEDLKVLDVAADPPADASLRNLDDGAFSPKEAALTVTVALDRSAFWVADAYRSEVLSDEPDGTRVVALPIGDRSWAVRLLLRLGGSARVIDPPDLAAEVVESVNQALAAYDDAG
jgi:proteasome accessory factor C